MIGNAQGADSFRSAVAEKQGEADAVGLEVELGTGVPLERFRQAADASSFCPSLRLGVLGVTFLNREEGGSRQGRQAAKKEAIQDCPLFLMDNRSPFPPI